MRKASRLSSAGVSAPLQIAGFGRDRAPAAELDSWLASRVHQGAISLITPPRPFAIPEEEYEERIGAGGGDSAGLGVYRLYRELGGREEGVALEIGAGAGSTTVSFAASAPGFTTLATDPSPAFLRLIGTRLERAGLGPRVRLATLDGEAINLFPSGLFDLVFMRAALHHVSDYEQFLADASSVLRPGGLLIFQEPFSDGYLNLGLIADALLSMNGQEFALSEDDERRLTAMRDSIYFLSNRGIVKEGEDKHCFYTDEIMALCQRYYAEVCFLRNQAFDQLGELPDLKSIGLRESACMGLMDYAKSFFTAHHLVSSDAIQLLDQHVAPIFARLNDLYRAGDGPALLAVVACKKADKAGFPGATAQYLGKGAQQARRGSAALRSRLGGALAAKR